MTLLREKPCIPCQGGVPPLGREQCEQLHRQLSPRWYLSHSKDRLCCSLELDAVSRDDDLYYLFREFGEVSERENHHPELRWSRPRLDVEIWTHKIGALVESDFILAAKMDFILGKFALNTVAFDEFWHTALPKNFSPPEGEWHPLPERNILVRRLSFKNFRTPWECVLRILKDRYWPRSLEIALGFGHLEIRLNDSCEKTCLDKINLLTNHPNNL